MSQSTVSRIWRAFALAPHRSQSFKLSTDPLFIGPRRSCKAAADLIADGYIG